MLHNAFHSWLGFSAMLMEECEHTNASSSHTCARLTRKEGSDDLEVSQVTAGVIAADKNSIDDSRSEQLEQAKPLSKNAQKKLIKMERYKVQKIERKAFEKSKRHQETERKRKEWEAKLASLSVAEQEKALTEKMEKRLIRKEKWCNKKDRLRQAMDSGQNLVLDLEFCDRMKPNELVSLVQQVMYAYAANAKAFEPVRLSLTGCTGEIQSRFARVSGFSNWFVHKEERSYLEVFEERKCDLVYLTADSDHLIDQLEECKVYIVGGLVDRNRWKGLTLQKARSQGIATAKLPITEHLKLNSSHVLTVNQVVEIILSFLELKDWQAALLRVIPLRKRSAEEKDQTSTDISTHLAENHKFDESMQSPNKNEVDRMDTKIPLVAVTTD